LRAKNADCVILVSDGVSATGMPDGKYMLGNLEVTVSGGVCRNSEGKLAGSTLTLDKALRNVIALGKSFEETTRMLTLNPAGLLGVEFKKGALRVGADADILLMDEELHLASIWIRGVALN
jgi:N-acetylglucosamine-6-phosphate deacetylase